MEELKDIKNIKYLDSIFPLAIGYKIVLILSVILILSLSFYLYKKIKFIKSWQHKVLLLLTKVKNQYSEIEAKKMSEQISYALKMILINQFGRQVAASRSGSSMLSLLEDNDPSHFKWTEEGIILINLPYMPDNQKVDKSLFLNLIDASINFLRKSYVNKL